MGDTKRDGAVPPQELFDDRVDIRERVPVRESRQPVRPDHAVKLCPRFLLDFWVEGERREEALERGELLSPPIQRSVRWAGSWGCMHPPCPGQLQPRTVSEVSKFWRTQGMCGVLTCVRHSRSAHGDAFFLSGRRGVESRNFIEDGAGH